MASNSNQASLDASSVSSVSHFFTSTPELAGVSDQYASSLLPKLKLTQSCIEKAQESIHAFTSNNQSIGNQDANGEHPYLKRSIY